MRPVREREKVRRLLQRGKLLRCQQTHNTKSLERGVGLGEIRELIPRRWGNGAVPISNADGLRRALSFGGQRLYDEAVDRRANDDLASDAGHCGGVCANKGASEQNDCGTRL